MTKKDVITIVLGAGASRAVSYAHRGEILSPLDADFFDLLQRLTDIEDPDRTAVESVLRQVDALSHGYRRSMERAFYTLHLAAYLERKLTGADDESREHQLLEHFARAVQALLRKAHGKKICAHHTALVERLGARDAIISFNYDLIVERALRSTAENFDIPIGEWLYRFEQAPPMESPLPALLKLHGSANWKLEGARFLLRTKDWEVFDQKPGFRGHSGEGTVFPIFLPFWDKRIEEPPWRHLWKTAFSQLRHTAALVVWGYSLAPTDVKSQQLFRITVGRRGTELKLCVIDPSMDTRQRWRDLLPKAQYWEYEAVESFLRYPPAWWKQQTSKKKKQSK
jgi:hypothetical protein